MSEENTSCCAGPGYASPQDEIKAPREQIVYTICIYTGTGIEKPDDLATIDVDENSSTYGEIIHRTEVGVVGDELHHMGWNASFQIRVGPELLDRVALGSCQHLLDFLKRGDGDNHVVESDQAYWIDSGYVENVYLVKVT